MAMLFALASPICPGYGTSSQHHPIPPICRRHHNRRESNSCFLLMIFYYITNPHISLSSLLSEFQHFGRFSNFKVNYTSEILNIFIRPCPTALKYLGIHISRDLSQLFALHFQPLLRKTLTIYNQGLFSSFDPINILTMDILPRFLFLFQTIPIAIPSILFKTIHQEFTKFIWALPWTHNNLRPLSTSSSILTSALLTLRDCINLKFHLSHPYSPLTSLFGNTSFPPALNTTTFLTWNKPDHRCTSQLFVNQSTLPSYTDA